eukprot:CAMPEP_0179940120 /NCGR_PEP_ID=MMETSP0983-20121128/16104_1 /TAXON_ID=483367 /ORGANISM="non described non described, Strain CCMP 2436" /LENGTH=65 /DNA_ID=CAMNT_0021846715 /DNA_START=187 /DNA_END=384 /DNA_ORIENTATION=-
MSRVAGLVAQRGAELGDEQSLEVGHELVVVGRHRGLELAAELGVLAHLAAEEDLHALLEGKKVRE